MDLVIFDCDGVLIDSEGIACRIDARELSGIGIAITPDAILGRFSGMSYQDMYRTLEAETGVRLPDGYRERVHALVLAACEAEGPSLAMPGVHQAIDALNGLAICVASSSSHHWLQRTLEQAGLWDRFAPNVYSALEVRRGKPAPDLFLLAAERMGVTPGRCVVVEDSVAGVKAAKAAGMTPLGFSGARHCGSEHRARLRGEGAETVFDDMGTLARFFTAQRGP